MTKRNDYIRIKYQNGPVKEHGVNGCFVEDVIEAAVQRIEYYQKGNFPCGENRLALHSLREALSHLKQRTKRRESQGVEGTNRPHGEV